MAEWDKTIDLKHLSGKHYIFSEFIVLLWMVQCHWTIFRISLLNSIDAVVHMYMFYSANTVISFKDKISQQSFMAYFCCAKIIEKFKSNLWWNVPFMVLGQILAHYYFLAKVDSYWHQWRVTIRWAIQALWSLFKCRYSNKKKIQQFYYVLTNWNNIQVLSCSNKPNPAAIDGKTNGLDGQVSGRACESCYGQYIGFIYY